MMIMIKLHKLNLSEKYIVHILLDSLPEILNKNNKTFNLHNITTYVVTISCTYFFYTDVAKIGTSLKCFD